MFMRITWGRIAAGRWNDFEAAFKDSVASQSLPKGLKSRWLVRDKKDPEVGYTISLWESEAALATYAKSPQREEIIARLRPFFIDQYSVTDCEVRSAEAV